MMAAFGIAFLVMRWAAYPMGVVALFNADAEKFLMAIGLWTFLSWWANQCFGLADYVAHKKAVSR